MKTILKNFKIAREIFFRKNKNLNYGEGGTLPQIIYQSMLTKIREERIKLNQRINRIIRN